MSDNLTEESKKKKPEKKESEKHKEFKKKEPVYRARRPRVKWSETEIKDLEAACLKV